MKKLLLIAFILPMLCVAQIPDPKPNTYVNDFTGTLSAGQLRVLNDSILSLEKQSSIQLAVIILNELPASLEIDEYALQVGRKWRVGNAKNGLVYVVSAKQHKQRLEVANMMQGTITDYDALHITDNMKPYLRSKDYFGGVQFLLSSIKEKLNPVNMKEQKDLGVAELKKKGESDSGGLLAIILSVIVVGAGIPIFFLWRNKKLREIEEEIQRKRLLNQAPFIPTSRRSYPPSARSSYIPPVIIAPISESRSDDSDNDSSRSGSSSDDNSSSYGNWGSGSSDSSSSSDSGFSGGGASNDF